MNKLYFPDFIPQLAVEIPDEDGSLLGYLAIDSTFSGKCCGGIRMGADVTDREIKGLAHAMSRKFAFMNMPIGGAKSGILCPDDADRSERTRRLEIFGRKLAPVLSGIYATGGDIGVGPEDVEIVKRAAGLPVQRHPGTFRGGYYTAFGVYVNIMTWMEYSGFRARDVTVLVQGYGKVGRPLARLLTDSGVRIVGVSTSAGAIYDSDGLDVTRLEGLQKLCGDACVIEYGHADFGPPDTLFNHPATVAVPGARAWSINEINVGNMKFDAVISAANIPITPLATAELEKLGTIVVPDYVSNSAGILACSLLKQGFTEEMVTNVVTQIYSDRLKDLLTMHDESGLSLGVIAERWCRRNLEQLTETRGSKSAWLRARLREDKGWSRIAERAALELYFGTGRILGGSKLPLDFLQRRAVKAVYHRAVRPIGRL